MYVKFFLFFDFLLEYLFCSLIGQSYNHSGDNFHGKKLNDKIIDAHKFLESKDYWYDH